MEELTQEEQKYVMTAAFNDAMEDIQIQERVACKKAECAESAAIGAVFCLPALAAAGWGYFVCTAGVIANALHCCHG